MSVFRRGGANAFKCETANLLFIFYLHDKPVLVSKVRRFLKWWKSWTDVLELEDNLTTQDSQPSLTCSTTSASSRGAGCLLVGLQEDTSRVPGEQRHGVNRAFLPKWPRSILRGKSHSEEIEWDQAPWVMPEGQGECCPHFSRATYEVTGGGILLTRQAAGDQHKGVRSKSNQLIWGGNRLRRDRNNNTTLEPRGEPDIWASPPNCVSWICFQDLCLHHLDQSQSSSGSPLEHPY